MAYMKVKGLDEYAEKVQRLSRNADKIMRRAVYKGGGVVADAVKKGLGDIPIQEGPNGLPPYARRGEKLMGVSSRQKKDLIKSMGLAHIQEKELGYINTKLGFDGYGSVPTKSHPNGIPNTLLMRSIESGTSFRKKNAVVRRSVNQAKASAVKAMADTIDDELRKEI